jgi:hypothetical protein
LLILSFLLAAVARERWPSVALLRLTGTFGTVYPIASTDSSHISGLANAITKQLQVSRANSKTAPDSPGIIVKENSEP